MMEQDVAVDGALTFLAAAGTHLVILSELVKENKRSPGELEYEANNYSGYAFGLYPQVEQAVSDRIGVAREDEGGRHGVRRRVILRYRLDGNDIMSVNVSPEDAANANSFFEGMKVRDYKTLAAPITYSLRMAAETWRAIGLGDPTRTDYASVFDGIKITPTTPGAWAFVTDHGRLAFINHTIDHLSKTLFVVPDSVYNSILDMGVIVNGARCIHMIGSPAGFIIQGGNRNNLLAEVDSDVIIKDNNSFDELVDGPEFARHGPALGLHRDIYEVLPFRTSFYLEEEAQHIRRAAERRKWEKRVGSVLWSDRAEQAAADVTMDVKPRPTEDGR
jgi:hypothetical protein